MTFAQRRNPLTTHFAERIPVVKWRISVVTCRHGHHDGNKRILFDFFFFWWKMFVTNASRRGRGGLFFLAHIKTALHRVCTGRPHDKHARVHDVRRLRMYEWANWIVHMVLPLKATHVRHVHYGVLNSLSPLVFEQGLLLALGTYTLQGKD